MMFTLMIVVCLSLVCVTNSWPSGAPPAACGSLQPNHGKPPQDKVKTPSPYSITVVGSSTVKQGGNVTLILDGETSSGFRGFVIVAESLDNQNQRVRTGRFESGNSLVKTTCGDDAGLTHNSNVKNSNLVIKWVAPPAPFAGQVNFWGTFVQSKSTFWIEIKGSQTVTVVVPVSVDSSTTTRAPPQQPTTTELETTVISTTSMVTETTTATTTTALPNTALPASTVAVPLFEKFENVGIGKTSPETKDVPLRRIPRFYRFLMSIYKLSYIGFPQL